VPQELLKQDVEI